MPTSRDFANMSRHKLFLQIGGSVEFGQRVVRREICSELAPNFHLENSTLNPATHGVGCQLD